VSRRRAAGRPDGGGSPAPSGGGPGSDPASAKLLAGGEAIATDDGDHDDGATAAAERDHDRHADVDDDAARGRALFAPTGLEQFVGVVEAAAEAERTRCGPGALVCPCYLCIGRRNRAAVQRCRAAGLYLAVTVIATSLSLVVGDLVRGLTDRSADVSVEVVSALALVVLVVDVCLASFVDRKFVLSPDWWVDVLASVSIVTDMPVTAAALGLGTLSDISGDGGAGSAVAALFGDARRVFRMLKLFRLIPVDRFAVEPPAGLSICAARLCRQSPRRIRFLRRLHAARRALRTQQRFKVEESRTLVGMTQVSAQLAGRIQFKVALAALLLIVVLPLLSRQRSARNSSPSPYATHAVGPTAPRVSTALETALRALGPGGAPSNASLLGVATALQSGDSAPLLYLEFAGVVVVEVPPGEYEKLLRSTEIGRVDVVLCPGGGGGGGGGGPAGGGAGRSLGLPASLGSDPCAGPGGGAALTARALLDVRSVVRDASLWDLLTTNVLMLVLCLQAALVTHDVDALLLRPMQRLASFLRPFYGDGIRLLQSRGWGVRDDTSPDDGEALSTRLLLAAAVALRSRLDQQASAQYTSKKVRGMLLAKARVHGSVGAAMSAYRPTLQAVGTFQQAALAEHRWARRASMGEEGEDEAGGVAVGRGRGRGGGAVSPASRAAAGRATAVRAILAAGPGGAAGGGGSVGGSSGVLSRTAGASVMARASSDDTSSDAVSRPGSGVEAGRAGAATLSPPASVGVSGPAAGGRGGRTFGGFASGASLEDVTGGDPDVDGPGAGGAPWPAEPARRGEGWGGGGAAGTVVRGGGGAAPGAVAGPAAAAEAGDRLPPIQPGGRRRQSRLSGSAAGDGESLDMALDGFTARTGASDASAEPSGQRAAAPLRPPRQSRGSEGRGGSPSSGDGGSARESGGRRRSVGRPRGVPGPASLSLRVAHGNMTPGGAASLASDGSAATSSPAPARRGAGRHAVAAPGGGPSPDSQLATAGTRGSGGGFAFGEEPVRGRAGAGRGDLTTDHHSRGATASGAAAAAAEEEARLAGEALTLAASGGRRASVDPMTGLSRPSHLLTGL